MNSNLAKYLIFLVILTSCEIQEKQTKKYGFPQKENSDLNVPLKISEFGNYGKLIDRIREISCNDSIPEIVIKKNNLKRNIYPIEHCDPAKFDPNGKHYVSFRNGKPFKDHSSKEITTDNLRLIIIEDFAYRKDKSDKPESYLIIIEANRNEKTKSIERFVASLTQEFDKLNSDLEMNIFFWEDFPHVPPPPAMESDKTK